MISIELLSEVLEIGIDKVGHYPKDNNLYYSFSPSGTQHINIYELAHKCKVWALNNGYHVTTLLYDDNATRVYTHGLATVHFSDENSNYTEVFSCESNTEPEAIIKAAQWVLDNKDKK